MPNENLAQIQLTFPVRSVGEFLQRDYNDARYREVTDALQGGLLLPNVLQQRLPASLHPNLRPELFTAARSHSASIHHIDVIQQAAQLNSLLSHEERASCHVERLREQFIEECNVVLTGDAPKLPFLYLQQLLPVDTDVSDRYRNAIHMLSDDFRVPQNIGRLNATQISYLSHAIEHDTGPHNMGLDGVNTDSLVIIARYLRSLTGE